MTTPRKLQLIRERLPVAVAVAADLNVKVLARSGVMVIIIITKEQIRVLPSETTSGCVCARMAVDGMRLILLGFTRYGNIRPTTTGLSRYHPHTSSCG